MIVMRIILTTICAASRQHKSNGQRDRRHFSLDRSQPHIFNWRSVKGRGRSKFAFDALEVRDLKLHDFCFQSGLAYDSVTVLFLDADDDPSADVEVMILTVVSMVMMPPQVNDVFRGIIPGVTEGGMGRILKRTASRLSGSTTPPVAAGGDGCLSVITPGKTVVLELDTEELREKLVGQGGKEGSGGV
jgi:hypothetical protein